MEKSRFARTFCSSRFSSASAMAMPVLCCSANWTARRRVRGSAMACGESAATITNSSAGAQSARNRELNICHLCWFEQIVNCRREKCIAGCVLFLKLFQGIARGSKVLGQCKRCLVLLDGTGRIALLIHDLSHQQVRLERRSFLTL